MVNDLTLEISLSEYRGENWLEIHRCIRLVGSGDAGRKKDIHNEGFQLLEKCRKKYQQEEMYNLCPSL